MCARCECARKLCYIEVAQGTMMVCYLLAVGDRQELWIGGMRPGLMHKAPQMSCSPCTEKHRLPALSEGSGEWKAQLGQTTCGTFFTESRTLRSTPSLKRTVQVQELRKSSCMPSHTSRCFICISDAAAIGSRSGNWATVTACACKCPFLAVLLIPMQYAES